MTAWQSHGEDCRCAGCEHEIAFMRSLQELEESDDHAPDESVWPLIGSYVKEALIWVALVGFILLLLRCGK
jgi:hypothetical protein